MLKNHEKLTLSQKIELWISLRGIFDSNGLQEVDPYVKVYFKKTPDEHFSKIGQTEVVKNSVTPDFSSSFMLEFLFYINQEIKFEAFDGRRKVAS